MAAIALPEGVSACDSSQYMGPTEIAPLQIDDADEMFETLSDPAIYIFLDERQPISAANLRERYTKLAPQISPDGKERWLNWVVRDAQSKRALGYVQATVAQQTGEAEVAYVLAPRAWGQGHGRRAVGQMLQWLDTQLGVTRFRAKVHPQNARSLRLLEWFGFVRAAEQATADLNLSMQLYPYRSQFGWLGDDGLGERMIARILNGTKTASAGPKDLFSKQELQQLQESVGRPTTVTDAEGRPRGTILMRDVFETPFGKPDPALVQGEGFGDDVGAFQDSLRRAWAPLVEAGKLVLNADTLLVAELFSVRC